MFSCYGSSANMIATQVGMGMSFGLQSTERVMRSLDKSEGKRVSIQKEEGEQNPVVHLSMADDRKVGLCDWSTEAKQKHCIGWGWAARRDIIWGVGYHSKDCVERASATGSFPTVVKWMVGRFRFSILK